MAAISAGNPVVEASRNGGPTTCLRHNHNGGGSGQASTDSERFGCAAGTIQPLDGNWNLGRSVWYNKYVTVQLWDSGSKIGPSVTFTTADLPNVGSSRTLSIYQDGSIGNGWNEIDYSLTATRIK